MGIKTILRGFIPKSAVGAYHYFLARVASVVYCYPSEKLIVIGVTGTNGKSSTAQFIGRILEQTNAKVGWTTTAGFKIAEKEWQNDKKMTMLGRFQSQKMLSEMVKAGCKYAIIETSSQGIAQHRHVGIHYDVAVFTNLTPEHIEAHGGFENYKTMKGQLFATLVKSRVKTIGGVKIKQASVINVMDEHADYFLLFKAGDIWRFGYERDNTQKQAEVYAKNVRFGADGTDFEIENTNFNLKLIGRFNFENALATVAACRALGLSFEQIKTGVSKLETVPGRLESINEGQFFTVIVDYGPEPAALNATYEALSLIEHKRIIHLLGSTGGGRDVARRSILGEIAGKQADIVIVTNEDPYDDDPMKIINDVADGTVKAGKKDNVDLFRILDRAEAIQKAVSLAQEGDLVLLTGKGNEPVMAVANGKKIPWDDRKAVRIALQKL